MAVRAEIKMNKLVIKKMTAGGTVTKYMPVTLSSGTVANSTSNAKVFGIAMAAGSSGDLIPVALLAGSGEIPVLVGTGGATENEFCIVSSGNDGLTNQTFGGGTTVKYAAGKFSQTGVAGDIVGLIPGAFASGAA